MKNWIVSIIFTPFQKLIEKQKQHKVAGLSFLRNDLMGLPLIISIWNDDEELYGDSPFDEESIM